MVARKPVNGSSIRTAVCELLGIEHPIALGGMPPTVNGPELVAAVSNAGGLGTVGTSSSHNAATRVREMTARIRDLTQRPFGLNILPFRLDRAMFDEVMAQRPPVVSFAWPAFDQPLEELFARAHDAGAKVMHMISRVPDAERAAAAGADVIIAQGCEGGGHVGQIGTMVLVPQVVSAVAPVPVLAAGGIADARGFAAALALGADGVLLGTRFLASSESPLHANFKHAILESDGHDTDLTEIPDLISGQVWPGALARAQRNALIREWSGREWEIRHRRAQIAKAVEVARAAGDADHAPLLFGQDAGLIHSIEAAGKIVTTLVDEACKILAARLPHLVREP